MAYLSVNEKIGMIFIYGESGRNVKQAVVLYNERFPERNTPSLSSFRRVVQRFSESGNVQTKTRIRQKTKTDEDNQIAILAAVVQDPHLSSRALAAGSGISQTSVIRILKQHKFYAYHMSLHQELHRNDFLNRVTFCQWAQEKIRVDINFFLSVLFSDESTFTNHGQVNRHNMHYWSVENPRWLRQVEHQRPWSVNVWAGIIGEKLIGPFFIDGTLNGEKYRTFLINKLPLLLEELNLQQRQTMWFQHDGCPAHYSGSVRQVLDSDYKGRWIGRGGPVPWPARSSDLTPLDFFLWGYLKEKVYQDIHTTTENMSERIHNACENITQEMFLTCHQSFLNRIEKCIEVEGHNFEHLLG